MLCAPVSFRAVSRAPHAQICRHMLKFARAMPPRGVGSGWYRIVCTLKSILILVPYNVERLLSQIYTSISILSVDSLHLTSGLCSLCARSVRLREPSSDGSMAALVPSVIAELRREVAGQATVFPRRDSHCLFQDSFR